LTPVTHKTTIKNTRAANAPLFLQFVMNFPRYWFCGSGVGNS